MKIKYNKWLLLIIVLGCILRFIDIATESYWFDEIYSIALAKYSFREIIVFTGRDVHPPLYYIILHIWVSIFGNNELIARSLSAIFSLATIPVLYIIANKIFNKKVALTAALIFAFSRINIYYSQECRMYTLLTLLASISYLLMIKIFQNKGSTKSKISLYIFYIVANTAMIYTHNFGFMILIAQVVYILVVLFKTKNIKTANVVPFGISYIVLFILYLPWLFVFLHQLSLVGKGFWLPAISKFSGGEAFIELSGSILLAIVFIVMLVISISNRKNSNIKFSQNTNYNYQAQIPQIGTGIFWLWFILPIAIPLSVSYFLSPIFNARYLLLTSPALILLVAVGVNKIQHIKFRYALIISILVLSVFALVEDWSTNEKEDWRSASKYLDKAAGKNDLIIVDICPEFDYLGDSKVLIEFYSKNKTLNYYSLASNRTKKDLDIMVSKIKNYNTIYFVKSHGKVYDKPMDDIIKSNGFTVNDSVFFDNYVRRYLYLAKYGNNQYDLYLKKCSKAQSIEIEILTQKKYN